MWSSLVASAPRGQRNDTRIPLATRLPLSWSWRPIVTLIALGVFGYIKGRFTGARALRSALQTIVIGGLAAGAAFLLAKSIS